MRPARAKVVGRFSGGGLTPATVTIDREVGLFTVRPHKRRKVYELPLAAVAEYVVWHVTKVELADAKKAKKAKEEARVTYDVLEALTDALAALDSVRPLGTTEIERDALSSARDAVRASIDAVIADASVLP